MITFTDQYGSSISRKPKFTSNDIPFCSVAHFKSYLKQQQIDPCPTESQIFTLLKNEEGSEKRVNDLQKKFAHLKLRRRGD